MAKRAFHEWLEVMPSNRIMGGADCNHAEGIYGATEFTRRCLAEVLAEKVQQPLAYYPSTMRASRPDLAEKLPCRGIIMLRASPLPILALFCFLLPLALSADEKKTFNGIHGKIKTVDVDAGTVTITTDEGTILKAPWESQSRRAARPGPVCCADVGSISPRTERGLGRPCRSRS
jgi:hypothetical protein